MEGTGVQTSVVRIQSGVSKVTSIKYKKIENLIENSKNTYGHVTEDKVSMSGYQRPEVKLALHARGRLNEEIGKAQAADEALRRVEEQLIWMRNKETKAIEEQQYQQNEKHKIEQKELRENVIRQRSEIDRVVRTTYINGEKVFNESTAGDTESQAVADAEIEEQEIAESAGIDSTDGISDGEMATSVQDGLSPAELPRDVLMTINSSISQVNKLRNNIGSIIEDFSYRISSPVSLGLDRMLTEERSDNSSEIQKEVEEVMNQIQVEEQNSFQVQANIPQGIVQSLLE